MLFQVASQRFIAQPIRVAVVDKRVGCLGGHGLTVLTVQVEKSCQLDWPYPVQVARVLWPPGGVESVDHAKPKMAADTGHIAVVQSASDSYIKTMSLEARSRLNRRGNLGLTCIQCM